MTILKQNNIITIIEVQASTDLSKTNSPTIRIITERILLNQKIFPYK